ncbi:MAG: ATP-binding protein [Gammaproteobacteria bacterium]
MSPSLDFRPIFHDQKVGKGNGQGLAIYCAIIVNIHGGKLYFESNSGKGRTFTVNLPVKPDEGIKPA